MPQRNCTFMNSASGINVNLFFCVFSFNKLYVLCTTKPVTGTGDTSCIRYFLFCSSVHGRSLLTSIKAPPPPCHQVFQTLNHVGSLMMCCLQNLAFAFCHCRNKSLGSSQFAILKKNFLFLIVLKQTHENFTLHSPLTKQVFNIEHTQSYLYKGCNKMSCITTIYACFIGLLILHIAYVF